MSGVARRQRLLAGVAGAAIVISLGLNTPARAQSAPMWTGFYIGGNAGAAWGKSHVSTLVDCSNPAGTGYFCNSTGAGTANAAALDASGTGDISDTAFTGGVQGGFNYQWGSAVVGIETDFDSFNLGGTRTANGVFPVAGPIPPELFPQGRPIRSRSRSTPIGYGLCAAAWAGSFSQTYSSMRPAVGPSPICKFRLRIVTTTAPGAAAALHRTRTAGRSAGVLNGHSTAIGHCGPNISI